MSLAAVAQGAALRALKMPGIAASATLAHVTPGAYDPATGGTTGTTTITPIRALLDASSTSSLGFKFGQDLVRSGDMKATVSGVTPQELDTLTILDGPYAGPYTVIKPMPIFVGSAAVMHECLVRR